jgi:hypothetical protein
MTYEVRVSATLKLNSESGGADYREDDQAVYVLFEDLEAASDEEAALQAIKLAGEQENWFDDDDEPMEADGATVVVNPIVEVFHSTRTTINTKCIQP